MKFSQMPYERPDIEKLTKSMSEKTEALKAAESYEAAREVFLDYLKEEAHIATLASISNVRHSIDTRDEFYDAEDKFWSMNGPVIEEYAQLWLSALLENRFRPQFEEEFGSLYFTNKEMDRKTFKPEIIEELQQENLLVQEYEDLLASSKIDFEGKTYTITQMTPLKTDPDDARRLAAWKAEGQWYKDNQAKLDEYYDKLVHLRDEMGKKLGYGGYTQLGYYRMTRNCYDAEDLKKFRAAVVKYIVPLASKIYEAQAKRLGKAYPMNFADNAIDFRDGNPKPAGSADDVVAAGKKFYGELSPETKEFFETMLDCELLDLLAKEGKQGGGYCTDFPEYKLPFIFANFNGSQGDVEVITHEAGHAFEAWFNRERVPYENAQATMEACEVHSMSMEFFADPWAEDFFGGDAKKYYYSHLAGAIKFIPYGTMVDDFQHRMYEKPEMSPAERHAVWKELLGIYMPWVKLGEIPFYGDGEGWQRQHHIYSFPFYYIDYCLAQTVSLEFWAMMQDDFEDAWKHYMAYTSQGGTATFTDLLKNAGMETPFDEDCFKAVCEKASKFLEEYEL